MRGIFALLSTFFICTSLSAQKLSQEVQQFVKLEAPVIALAHVRVIDGTGADAKEDQVLIISQGKIATVGDSASVSIPKDAKILDLKGESVFPGLVGMHDHMFYPVGSGVYGDMAYSFPRLYLAGGVTTIRTTGSLEPYTDLQLKTAIDEGEVPGPHMHVTGPYLEGKGALILQLHELSGPDDATRTVNYWLDEGVDNFKAYMFITPAELSAAIAAAHQRGTKVTGHLCSIGFREAASLGIDDLEHGLLVDTEFFPWKKPDICSNDPKEMAYIAKLDVNSGPVHDMIVDLVQHHVAMTSTLPVFEVDVPGRPPLDARVLNALAPEARADFLANKVRRGAPTYLRKRYGNDVSPWPAALAKEMEFERAFVKAGGLLLAGLDPTGIGGVVAGFGDQREVELLVDAGFTPLEAIQIATSNGAKYLGESDKIGTIAAGKQADLVVVKGDPSKNIADIEKINFVFKDGVGYDSEKLIDAARGHVGIN